MLLKRNCSWQPVDDIVEMLVVYGQAGKAWRVKAQKDRKRALEKPATAETGYGPS